LSDFTFSTAEAFLREAAAAKQNKRDAISASIAPHLADHGTVGIPPQLHQGIDKLLERYGDEAYRQVALYCLGKWFEAHTEAAEDLFATGRMPEAVACMMDATRISDSLHLVCEVGSLGGDQDWKIMLEEELSQAILEHIEEDCL
jgi:hypothetical protein